MNSSRIADENKSFRGSNVYLTMMEKEALKRAISQYIADVEGADEDGSFVEFFNKYDAAPLSSAYKKLCKR